MTRERREPVHERHVLLPWRDEVSALVESE